MSDSVTRNIFSQSDRQTAAHLTSEVADTLGRLQDGHLHVLRGLFGVDRLLLR